MEVEEDYLYIAKRGASGYSGLVSRVFLETNERDWKYQPEKEVDFESLFILGDYVYALDNENKIHWINKNTGRGGVLAEDSNINSLYLVEEELIQQKTAPTITLKTEEYDIYNPNDVIVEINWNDAEKEVVLVYNNDELIENSDYEINNNDELVIYSEFFEEKDLEEEYLDFEIFFNIEELYFQVEAIDTAPSDDENDDENDDEESIFLIYYNNPNEWSEVTMRYQIDNQDGEVFREIMTESSEYAGWFKNELNTSGITKIRTYFCEGEAEENEECQEDGMYPGESLFWKVEETRIVCVEKETQEEEEDFYCFFPEE